MKIIDKLIDRIENYICDVLAPAFGVLCVTFAGNWQTRLFGIVILVLDFIAYKGKDDIYRN
ncbi:MAG: hypothetical protein HFI08_02030 [Bacilli bacterium]|jgi:predicted cobalt transporter CbtA|nr:hypothetical protein [Bacilli bacterium]